MSLDLQSGRVQILAVQRGRVPELGDKATEGSAPHSAEEGVRGGDAMVCAAKVGRPGDVTDTHS